jgi:hypothetical protein
MRTSGSIADEIKKFTSENLKMHARKGSNVGTIDFKVSKPTSLTTFNKMGIESPKKRQLYPISSKTITESTSAVPNYKFGSGHDHGIFTTV